MKILSQIFVLFSLLLIVSCQSNPNSEINKPLAIDKTNNINVICSESAWNSYLGDTLRYYLESPFPITPNPEPLFNLRHFTYEQIEAEQLRRQLRTYLILVDTKDTSSGTYKMFRKDIGKQRFDKIETENISIVYGKDKWARKQLVIYLIGQGNDSLISNFVANFEKISKKVYENDRPQIYTATYFIGENKNSATEIFDTFGYNIKIPNDFNQALFSKDDAFAWYRRDSKKSIINFMTGKIKMKDYINNGSFDVVKLVNRLGSNVTASQPGSVLVANSKDAPILNFDDNINNIPAKEYRGIWEMTKDFMGGPYILIVLDTPLNDDNIFFFGFLFGPGDDKKEYLQQLMEIAHTIDFSKK
ncbi:MAG: DUF4837 family protein [Saprospiraceae bacterium]